MNQEEAESWGMLALFFLLILSILISHFFKRKKVQFIHQTGISIALGILGGFIIKYGFHIGERFQSFFSFDEDIFMLFLLPQIIFESGYNMQRRHFFRNFGSVILFAILGTIISTFLIGGFLIILSDHGVILKLTHIECLLFGSLISATDPVCVLSIFKHLGVDVNLYSNVFGESVLNDAISIVLFETLTRFEENTRISTKVVFQSLGMFLLSL
ncbi:sodium/hydrogen exchanger [Anaeramoeba ignava]|uniref:Sodium/hydrogen exchanger n=1 Tax=Anaeramoeba ignava TaxID=1746090 RepID=A0A9Q0LR67_ANAIG|nr:sodium/hydrogen exchanger [Anaeramoeba ignava]